MMHNLESKIGFLVQSGEHYTRVFRVSAVCELNVPENSNICLYIIPSISEARMGEFINGVKEGYQILEKLEITAEIALKDKIRDDIEDIRKATITRPQTPEALTRQIANFLQEVKSYELLECLQFSDDIFLFPPQDEAKDSIKHGKNYQNKLVFLPL